MRRAARHLAWVVGTAVVCLLALALLAGGPSAMVEARSEGGHWQQTEVKIFVTRTDAGSNKTCQVSDGSASLTITSPQTGDLFVSTATWSSPESSYQDGERVELTIQAKIDTYIRNAKDDGYLHPGLNNVGNNLVAKIDVAGIEGNGTTAGAIRLTDANGEYIFTVRGQDGVKTVPSAGGKVSGVMPAGYTTGDLRAIYVDSDSGTVRYTYSWVAEGDEAPVTTQTTVKPAGDATDDTPGETTGRMAGKVPGPQRWWEWLTGTLVPGLVAGGLSLVGSLFGGGGAPPAPPRPKFVPYPYDGPSIGPPKPYRDTPDGPLKYPPGTTPPPGYRPPEGPPAEWVPQNEDEAYRKTLLDGAKALAGGVYDFTAGTLKTIVTGWEEIGMLGYELTDSRGRSPLREVWESPSIVIWRTPLNIVKDILESVNPTEEWEALNDPNMSPEGKAWAASSMALKIANAILIWESGKDLKKGLEAKYKDFKDYVGRAPKKPTPIAPKAVKPPDPTARTSKMTPAEATAQAEKMVPAEKAAAYEKYKSTVESTVDDFAEKVKSGEPVTPQDVLEVTKDPGMTRRVLGKGGEPVPPEVTEAVKSGRRAIYNETDDAIRTELQKDPKYAEGKIRAKEVSTGGEADAAGSADRDVQYIHEKQVAGKDGKMRTVEEPIPRSDVEAIHNEAFAKASKFDPAKPVEGFDQATWDRMSLQDKQAAHARQYQQNVMDRTSPEYIAEYSSERPPSVSPEEWQQMSLAEKQAAHGKATGKMTSDPAEMGRIYQETKFKELWEQGTPGQQTEALRQLGKTGDAAQQAAQSSGRALDPQTLDALEIVKRGGDPAVVDQAVRNLGVHGGVEGLANRLRSVIESKKFNLPVPK